MGVLFLNSLIMKDFNVLNYLKLDKCKTKKERAAILQKEIVRREDELKSIREMYRGVFESVVGEWHSEFIATFPELAQHTLKSKNEMWVEIAVDDIHYNISIGKDKRKLFCLAKIITKDYVDGKHITDDMVRKLNDLLSWKRGNELMLEWFDANDFDAAFSCFCKLVERFLNWQKT